MSPSAAQTTPVGHAVRFAYLETAVAMLHRATGDATLLPALTQAWEHMVTRRMCVTGGVGAVPVNEGFGRDYELDPEIIYAETCAALGCMFWNRELALVTGEAKYDDLFEWQLYNAAAVGMGVDGRSYLYNNPLACRGGITRAAVVQRALLPVQHLTHLGRAGRLSLQRRGRQPAHPPVCGQRGGAGRGRAGDPAAGDWLAVVGPRAHHA